MTARLDASPLQSAALAGFRNSPEFPEARKLGRKGKYPAFFEAVATPARLGLPARPGQEVCNDVPRVHGLGSKVTGVNRAGAHKHRTLSGFAPVARLPAKLRWSLGSRLKDGLDWILDVLIRGFRFHSTALFEGTSVT